CTRPSTLCGVWLRSGSPPENPPPPETSFFRSPCCGPPRGASATWTCGRRPYSSSPQGVPWKSALGWAPGLLPLHHAPAHLAPGFLRFLFTTNARRLVIFPPLDFLHNAVSFAFLFEAPQRLFNRLVLSHFNNDQCHTILSTQ